MTKQVDQVRYNTLNIWTETTDSSGTSTKVDYAGFDNISRTETPTGISFKGTEPNTDLTIEKGDLVEEKVSELELYDYSKNCWRISRVNYGSLIRPSGGYVLSVIIDGKVVAMKAKGSESELLNTTEISNMIDPSITYKRGSGRKNPVQANILNISFLQEVSYPVIVKDGVKRYYKIRIFGEESVTSPVVTAPPTQTIPATIPAPVPQARTATEENTTRIRNRTISLKISQAPNTIQNLRAKIIFNAIQFAREIESHKFTQLGEIIRVCTALGVERAYLRGLQHAIGSEKDIDKYIYRFDLRGCLPFVDRNTVSIDSTKMFLTPTGSTILFFCLTNQNETFTQLTRDTLHFVDPSPDPFNIEKIQSEVVDQRLLPEFVMIPKYATDYIVNGTDYICEVLNNKFEFGDLNGHTCLTSIDVASSATIEPDKNMMVPINMNPYPYMTPNSGLSYRKTVYPAPIPVRMVMDGVPLTDEDVIIANRFKLSGVVKIEPGEEIIVRAVAGDQITTDVKLPPGGIIRTPVFELPINAIPPVDYAGPGVYILDPIVGTDTKFTEELSVGDIVELVNNGKQISGKFFTVGTNKLYYEGEELTDFYNRYGSISVVIDGWTYALSSIEETHETAQEFRSSNRIYSYNTIFEITSSEFLTDQNDDGEEDEKEISIKSRKDDLLRSISEVVTFIPDPINSKIGKLRFANINPQQYFEVGEEFFLTEITAKKRIIDADGNIEYDNVSRHSNAKFSFGGFEGNDLLVNCFSFEQYELPIQFSTTLVRAQKDTPFLTEPVNGFYQKHWIYHRVTSIESDTKIEIFPEADVSFSGNLYRVGFNIHSASQNPGLQNNGLDEDCAIQFQKKGEIKNSKTFYMPAADSNKVVIYEGDEIDDASSFASQVESYAGSNQILSAKAALADYNFITVNYEVFEEQLTADNRLGRPIYETEYSTTEHLQELDLAEIGMLYFNNMSGQLDQITLETVDHIDRSQISNGFGEDDELIVRIMPMTASAGDDPYGELAKPDDGAPLDYHSCGLGLNVVEVISPYRFTVDNLGIPSPTTTASFFDKYERETNFYLTITNGRSNEYWQKYFDDVYFDGTVETYDGDGLPTRSLELMQKFDSSDYLPNYNQSEITLNDYPLGSSPLVISTTGQGYTLAPGATTDQGVFLLSIEDEPVRRIPPSLLDVFPLRAAMFEGDEE